MRYLGRLFALFFPLVTSCREIDVFRHICHRLHCLRLKDGHEVLQAIPHCATYEQCSQGHYE